MRVATYGKCRFFAISSESELKDDLSLQKKNKIIMDITASVKKERRLRCIHICCSLAVLIVFIQKVRSGVHTKVEKPLLFQMARGEENLAIVLFWSNGTMLVPGPKDNDGLAWIQAD